LTSASASYVLPLGRDADDAGPELATYLHWLASRLEVVVVDGSPATVFNEHRRQWGDDVVHVPVESRCLNGKVAGVLDGLRVATGEVVVIADDDVRYDATALDRVLELAGEAELVRPQNYFDPLPWHARWDTGRSLLNRAFGADYPGTLVVRMAMVHPGGYCGAVLFENLELIRTVRARGGREVRASDVYVRRVPPDVRHFAGQRVRQAYDSLAQPGRLAVELALLPAAAVGLWRHGTRWLIPAAALTSVALAELGRRRYAGAQVFSRDAAWWAPLWVAERSICIWLALARRARGGVPYAGHRLLRAAHPARRLTDKCPEPSCSCVVASRRPPVVRGQQRAPLPEE